MMLGDYTSQLNPPPSSSNARSRGAGEGTCFHSIAHHRDTTDGYKMLQDLPSWLDCWGITSCISKPFLVYPHKKVIQPTNKLEGDITRSSLLAITISPSKWLYRFFINEFGHGRIKQRGVIVRNSWRLSAPNHWGWLKLIEGETPRANNTVQKTCHRIGVTAGSNQWIKCEVIRMFCW